MNGIAITCLQVIWLQLSDRLVRRLALAAVILFLVLLLISPTFVSAYAGLGAYISEKTLGRSDVSSSLYLGSGTSGPIVLGSGPAISTGTVTNNIIGAGGAVATLHGTLSSLNGFPRADIWFVWGDSPVNLNHTSSVVTVTTIGEKTIDISGYDPAGRVYYQFRSSTDGTSIGSVASFIVTGGRGIAYWLIINILTLLIAASTLLMALRFAHNYVAMLIVVIIGIMAIFIVRAFVNSIL